MSFEFVLESGSAIRLERFCFDRYLIKKELEKNETQNI
jgi:hypothetical protein